MSPWASTSDGPARLRAAATSGALDAFCRRHRVLVVTVFGSAGRGEPSPRDLDVAVLTDAIAERVATDPMRRISLELLAARH